MLEEEEKKLEEEEKSWKHNLPYRNTLFEKMKS